jgi:hypothetical protein
MHPIVLMVTWRCMFGTTCSSSVLFGHGGASHMSASSDSCSVCQLTTFLVTVSPFFSYEPSNTSSDQGQQESTLLSSYIKAAKLKHWLNRPSCPPVFRDIKSLFDRFVSPTVDAIIEDSLVPTTPNEDIPADLRSLIKVKRAILHACVTYKGSIYTRESTHAGNSLVLYYPDGVTHTQVPGTIRYIFRTKDGLGFAVQRHLPLHSYPDPFRHYPYFPAQLHSSSLADHLEVVRPEWVVSHFARWNFSPQHIVAVSLCPVHVPFSLTCFNGLTNY